MPHIIKLAVLGLLLAGCTKTVTKEVPVEVLIPVAKGCPVPVLRTVDRPPALGISLVTPDTQMDKDVDYAKATILELFAYVAGLETAVRDRDEALKVCADVQ